MKDKITALIVDDVDMMRITLKKILEKFPKIQVIGEAADYESAKSAINDLQPDLVFLDIDLNGLTSIDILSHVNHNPKIIFVTSHPDFALKAFELNAVDYILKPISFDRISKAIERVTDEELAKIDAEPNTAAAKTELTPSTDDEKFEDDQVILLNFENKMSFVKIAEIDFIEAFGNYTKVHMNDGRLSTTYNSIKNWDNRLPSDTFIQIHRSTIVNLLKINKIERWTNDTGRLHLKGYEEPFDISRSYFSQIKKKYKI